MSSKNGSGYRHKPNKHTLQSCELTKEFYSHHNNEPSRTKVTLNSLGLTLWREFDHSSTNENVILINDIIGSECGHVQKDKRTCGRFAKCQLTNNNKEQLSQCTDCTGELKTSCVYLYIYAYIKHEKPLRRDRRVEVLLFHAHEQLEDNMREAERWQQAIASNKLGRQLAGVKRKPLLILLNPKAGTGKGRELFQSQVLPILKEANMPYELQVTTHANFARDFIRQHKRLALEYSGIVVASGDGLFYEVLNGMMEREDWQKVCKQLPVGIVPCGSGNGLAKSIAHLHDEPYEPKPIQNAALNCVSGKTSPMDILHVQVSNNADKPKDMYSFLSVGWGLIADVDIESEFLRVLGEYRFTLWCIRRLIGLRTYKGKLHYLPHELNSTHMASMPPLREPLPTDSSTWRSEEGEYVMVMATYTTHLSADCFFAPKSRLNDGIIYLTIIRSGVSRLELVQFLINMSTGTHLPEAEHNYIQVLPVSAFRIEPNAAEKGIITVDGELVEYGPIQGKIVPGVINIMVPG